MWYWIWGIAERAELDNWKPRRFWWWLQRICARKHGFVKSEGNITEDEAKELLRGPLSPGKLETIYDDSEQLKLKPKDSKQTCFECGCICDSGNICDECARDAGNFD